MAAPKIVTVPALWVTKEPDSWLTSILTELRKLEKEASQ